MPQNRPEAWRRAGSVSVAHKGSEFGSCAEGTESLTCQVFADKHSVPLETVLDVHIHTHTAVCSGSGYFGVLV